MGVRVTVTDASDPDVIGTTWTTDDDGTHHTIRDLTFDRVTGMNNMRCRRWHNPDTDAWTGADWSNAMCGEAGEAANVVKKLRRHETRTSPQGDPSYEELRKALGYEIADTILYALLLGAHYEIDIPTALVEKFNLVSAKNGFPEQLP
jgi:NTP pyrophosphatase (non-canonical NTP hydrolase)